MRAVNLLPADARVSTSPLASFGSGLNARKAMQIGGALTILVAALFAALYVHERSVVHDKRARLANDQARLVAVQAQVDAIKAAQAQSTARLNAVRTVVDSRMNWDRTMGDMARILPHDVYLTSLTANAPVTAAAAGLASIDAATPPAAPASLTINGVAGSYVRVAAVLDRLALLPWLTGVTLQSTARGQDGQTTFGVTGNVSEVH